MDNPPCTAMPPARDDTASVEAVELKAFRPDPRSLASQKALKAEVEGLPMREGASGLRARGNHQTSVEMQLASLKQELEQLREAAQMGIRPPEAGFPLPNRDDDVSADFSDLMNMYTYCVHLTLRARAHPQRALAAILCLYFIQGIQLLLSFGAYDTGIGLGILDSQPAFAVPVPITPFYANHVFCVNDDGTTTCWPRINFVCSLVGIVMVATWLKGALTAARNEPRPSCAPGASPRPLSNGTHATHPMPLLANFF